MSLKITSKELHQTPVNKPCGSKIYTCSNSDIASTSTAMLRTVLSMLVNLQMYDSTEWNIVGKENVKTSFQR